MNCSCHTAVKLLKHEMVVVERVLEKRLCRIVTVDEMQFYFIPRRGIVDAVFVLRRLQEEYHAKGKKLYICFVDTEKAYKSKMESDGMGNEEERNTSETSDESVSGSKDKNESGL